MKKNELGFVMLKLRYEDLRDFTHNIKYKTKEQLGLDDEGFGYLVELYLRLAEVKGGAIEGGLDEVEFGYPLDNILPTIDILYRMILHVNKFEDAEDILLMLNLERILRGFLAGRVEFI